MTMLELNSRGGTSYTLGLLTRKISSIENLLYALVGIGGAILVAVVGGIVELVWRLGG